MDRLCDNNKIKYKNDKIKYDDSKADRYQMNY